METIIVEIHVPATSARFDFRLPSTGRIGDVTDEVIRLLEATQQNLFFDRARTMLCDRDRGVVLRREDTVAEAGLRDGAQLLLV